MYMPGGTASALLPYESLEMKHLWTESRVAMNSDVSRTDESNGRGSGWTSIPLLPGVWVCLGFTFVWLVWNTYDSYMLTT